MHHQPPLPRRITSSLCADIVFGRDKGAVTPELEEGGKSRGGAKEIDFKSFPTLPQLIVGETGSRTSADQVTCFLNNVGLGYQFAAAGAVAYAKAKAQGRGHELPTDWFTEDVHP